MRLPINSTAVPILVFVMCFLAREMPAQSPVVLTINTRFPSTTVPSDFGVFSFETASLRYGSKGYNPNGYFFNATNAQLLTLFHNLGVRGLRIGGDSVDSSYFPSTNDVDSYFGFAKAANLKTLYSLDMAGSTPSRDASVARYIWQNYQTNVICLAIGNEPNEYKVNGQDHSITNFSTFMEAWKRFSSAVIGAVPGIRLGGPDNDDAAGSWTARYARTERDTTNVSCILYHFKPLRSAKGKTEDQLIAGELAPGLDATNYPSCYNRIGGTARSFGLSYRFSEFNDYVAPIKTTLTDYSFAAALFSLDALHWWSAHNCLGVYFHTGLHGFHAAFYRDSNGNYQLYPIGYGIAAFNIGGYGDVEPLNMTNLERLNLTAYAVKNDTNLYVTIINREYGKNARSAAVTIRPEGFVNGNVAVMFLLQANDDVAATNGVMLGGKSISSADPWLGQWNPLAPVTDGHCAIIVPASSAAVVKISESVVVGRILKSGDPSNEPVLAR
ncbi:MAG TPA: hypothetical protein VH280_17305 [Verrucomicrobiae bacterium]|jgi:hypothetical protein|nr:hypothetical protein [Verrucomicrobiae bacterium]